MPRKVVQIIARGDRRWLIRVYLGRDHETNKRKYHNRTIHGSMREAQSCLTRKLREHDLGRDLEGILADRHSKQIIFSALDPEKGRGGEIARLDASLRNAWALSPDSARIAVVDQSNRIRLIKLADGTSSEFSLAHWQDIQTMALSIHSSHIFLSAWSPDNTSNALRSVDSRGNEQVLEQVRSGQAWLCCPVASPDGHHLAFEKRTFENNVVMLENF